jgi:radical SAM protein with 4Fe4S-binding SPASM domain
MSANDVVREIDGATETFRAWEEEHGILVSPSIHFTGGEPLLFEGLWDVIAHARRSGYVAAMMSNGSLMTPADAARSAALGISDIQISLEGLPELHEAIRGKGSFASMAKGVKALVEAGQRVSANVTLSRLNVGEVEETIRIAEEMGFSSIGFSRLVPCGRGKELLDDFLTPEELKAAYQKALSLHRSSFAVISGDPLPGALLQSRSPEGCDLTLSGCSAGFSGITITGDGTVMPCRRIGLPAGNLKRKSLRAIWATSRLLWRLRRRESSRGKCGRCPLWPSCRGCRAVAYAYSALHGHADLFADDPQCWMRA